MQATTNNDWDLICATLHWNGVARGRLSVNMWEQAWSLGDGYGKMTLGELKRMELVGDWSHIRDSSPEATVDVARKIRLALGKAGVEQVLLAIAANGGPTR